MKPTMSSQLTDNSRNAPGNFNNHSKMTNSNKNNYLLMKKTIVYSINFLFGMLLIFLPAYLKAQSITQIKITGIRSAKGKIIIQVFKDNESYNQEKPYKKITFDKRTMANGTLSVKYEIEPGIYGFTLVDDENDNGIIDKNFIKIPKEGFGFSNFFMEKMKKPVFDDFMVKSQQKVEIRVKYM